MTKKYLKHVKWARPFWKGSYCKQKTPKQPRLLRGDGAVVSCCPLCKLIREWNTWSYSNDPMQTSGLACMAHGATWSSGRCHYHGRRIGIRWSLTWDISNFHETLKITVNSCISSGAWLIPISRCITLLGSYLMIFSIWLSEGARPSTG